MTGKVRIYRCHKYLYSSTELYCKFENSSAVHKPTGDVAIGCHVSGTVTVLLHVKSQVCLVQCKQAKVT